MLTVEATKVGKETLAGSSSWWNGRRAAKRRSNVVDQVSAYFVPAVIALAAITFVVWMAAGAGFVPALRAADRGANDRLSLRRALP
ncbi:MAG: hypothetical protein R2856_26305 [Caldilineaceae bacterium]